MTIASQGPEISTRGVGAAAVNRTTRSPAWLAIAFFSGIPALVAQVVWSRQVALAAGSESEALALVVALFFAGLALGARILGSTIERSDRPALRWYAGLEAGIGGVLIAVGLLDLTGRCADVAEFVGLGRRFGAALPILPATFLMGGTLPALLRAAVGGGAVSRDAGRLVASNTLGSVVGVILAVVSIPNAGLSTCLTAAGLLGLAVAGVASLMSAAVAAVAKPESVPAPRIPGAPSVATVRAFAFSTGFVTLAFEVTIARLCALALGSSLFAWGAVLATTLAGLALGNAFGGLASRDPARVPSRLPVLLMFAAIALVSSPWVLGHHPAELARGLTATTLVRSVLSVTPAMCALGAGYPMLVALAVREEGRAADFGRLTAFNTLGGVVGSLAAAFVLLPAFGPSGALQAIAGVAAAAALFFSARTLAQDDAPLANVEGSRVGLALAFAALLVVGNLASRAPVSPSLRDRVLSLTHGTRATTVVMRTARSRELVVDGDPEASTYGRARRTEALLAVLPFAYHPAPERFLELGLGAGLTLATAGRFAPDTLEVVEIAPSVVSAQALFAPDNAPRAGSRDPAPRILIGDARSYLRRAARGDDTFPRYDVIAANTAQPWSVHASGLYAQEHYARMRDALAEGGLVAQWLPYEGVSQASLGEILRTFFSVFDHGGLWWGDGSVFLLGSASPLAPFDAGRVAARLAAADLPPAALGLASVDAIPLRRLASADTIRAALSDHAILTEDRPRLEGRGRAAETGAGLALVSRLVEAERADDARVAAIAEYVRSLQLEAAGDERGAAAIQSTLRSAGLALGEQAALERGLRAIDAALAEADYAEAGTLRSSLPRALANEPRVHALDGILAENARRPADAEGAYRLGMSLAPRDAINAIRLGLFLESRRPDAATRTFERALRVDPYSIDAIAGIGRLAAREGDLERATRELERLRALSPLGPRPETDALSREIERVTTAGARD